MLILCGRHISMFLGQIREKKELNMCSYGTHNLDREIENKQ